MKSTSSASPPAWNEKNQYSIAPPRGSRSSIAGAYPFDVDGVHGVRPNTFRSARGEASPLAERYLAGVVPAALEVLREVGLVVEADVDGDSGFQLGTRPSLQDTSAQAAMRSMPATSTRVHKGKRDPMPQGPRPQDQWEHGPRRKQSGNHCMTPSGQDGNELLGVAEQLIAGPCRFVDAGEPFIPVAFWWTNAGWETVPNGFSPSQPTPMEDFLSKLESLNLVVDPGTANERTETFPGRDVWKVIPVGEILRGLIPPDGKPSPLPTPSQSCTPSRWASTS
jgi:hypothetical protein